MYAVSITVPAAASAITLALLLANTTEQIRARANAPAPLDAITTILDACRTHSIVALDEEHGDERSAGFRLSLIRDPRFPAVVNDILVEFGNSRYQNVIDRFIDGAPVVGDDLKKVWQNTTQAHAIWDRPIYEDFFRAVREINTSLPPGRHLRVLLGDPPIDWEAVRTADDLRIGSAGRSRYPADVIVREVLAKGRHVLVIYGAFHLWRQNLQGPNLIERLERQEGVNTFVIITHPLASLDVLGSNPASWPVPSIALTRGSSLENQLDAILYLGPPSGRKTSHLTGALCSDARYRDMRTRRMALAGNGKAAELLDRECTAAR